MLRGGRVEFVVPRGNERCQGTASFQAGKLALTWKDENGVGEEFTCERVPATEAQWVNSKALAPLYLSGGTYTTTKPSDGARPIARVWRNPAEKLVARSGCRTGEVNWLLAQRQTRLPTMAWASGAGFEMV